MEILIPILMFAIPIAAAILDSKNRKKNSGPEVLAEPIIFPEIEAEDGPKESNEARLKPQVTKLKPQKPAQKTVAKKFTPVPETEEESMKIDPKKLIIYSEILKPKFDE